MPRVQVKRFDDPAAYLGAAEPLLLADEARHNLMLGIAGNLRDHPGLYLEFRGWVAEDDGDVVGAALQTPPYNLVLARASAPGGVEALADALWRERAELPGVTAAVPEVEEFADAWIGRARLERQRADAPADLPADHGATGPGRPRTPALGDGGRPRAPPRVGARVRTRELRRRRPEGRRAAGRRTARPRRRGVRALGGRRSARLARRLGRRDAERRPDRARVHAARAPAARLRERADRVRLCEAARRGPPLLLPLHRPRERDREPHLRARSATSRSATRSTTLSCPAGQETSA